MQIYEKESNGKDSTQISEMLDIDNGIRNRSKEAQLGLQESESMDSIGTNDIFQLEPPYLIPRPRFFPVPTLTVTVVSANNLEGNTALPRPVNPFVSMTLSGQSFKSSVKKNTKNPVWDVSQVNLDTNKTKKYQEVDKRKFEYKFDAPDDSAVLSVCIYDWKPGQNAWISRLSIPLSAIEVYRKDYDTEYEKAMKLTGSNEGRIIDGETESSLSQTTLINEDGRVTKEFKLQCRKSRFSNQVEDAGQGSASLCLMFKYENMERWWVVQELLARDAKKQKELEEEEEERLRHENEAPSLDGESQISITTYTNVPSVSKRTSHEDTNCSLM